MKCAAIAVTSIRPPAALRGPAPNAAWPRPREEGRRCRQPPGPLLLTRTRSSSARCSHRSSTMYPAPLRPSTPNPLSCPLRIPLRAWSSGRSNWSLPATSSACAAPAPGDTGAALLLHPVLLREWRRSGHWAQEWIALRTLVSILVRAGTVDGAAAILGGLREHNQAEAWGADGEDLRLAEVDLQQELGEEFAARLARGSSRTALELVLLAEQTSEQAAVSVLSSMTDGSRNTLKIRRWSASCGGRSEVRGRFASSLSDFGTRHRLLPLGRCRFASSHPDLVDELADHRGEHRPLAPPASARCRRLGLVLSSGGLCHAPVVGRER